MVKLLDKFEVDKKNMNASYCEALIATAEANKNMIVMDCDVSHSVGTLKFFEQFPDRALNCGIQEANACCMAAGLSAQGFVPFVHSFAVFTSRRMLDQLFISGAYAGRNIKLIGGDVGVSAAGNGGTHMSFEDIGSLRSVPGVTILDASDPVMLKQLVPQMAEHYGVDYLRMPRKSIIKLYTDDSKFEIGKGALLREGTDVTIIACGVLVYEAILAANALNEEGISVRLIDMHTIKPLDEALVLESAAKTGAIVTVENHNYIGGLGSAVAECLCENLPTPLERVGVRDEFGEVGSQSDLIKRFGLSAKDIYEKAKKAIARKANLS